MRRQNPETRPKKMKKSPAPLFHAFRKKVRRQMYETYAFFANIEQAIRVQLGLS